MRHEKLGVQSETVELLRWQHSAKSWKLKHNISRSLRLGQSRSHQKGRGIEFYNARLYQPGDDAKAIDWRITARKNKAHTREFQEDKEHKLFMILDMSQSMRFGSTSTLKSVKASEVAAFIGWVALENQERVGGAILGNPWTLQKPSSRQARFSLWLGQLSLATINVADNLALPNHQWVNGIEESTRLLKDSSSVFLIGDLSNLSDLDKDRLRFFSKKHLITMIHIYDHLEQQLPSGSLASFTDGSHVLHTNLNRIRNHYNDQYQNIIESLHEFCGNYGIGFMSISTEDDVIYRLQKHGLITK